MIERIRLLGYPVLASEHGVTMDRIMLYIHLVMIAVFIGWTIFCIIALWKFRQSRHPKANYEGTKSHLSHWAEVLIIAAEVAILAGLAIPFWVREVAARPDPAANPVEVRVVAQQFAWNIHYPGADGIFGRTSPEFVDDASNPVGLDRNDAAGTDDIVTLNQLHLPVDRPAVVQLTSKDVIHSFFLPELRVKRDAIPGMVIEVPFKPTMTTETFRQIKGDQNRTFEIACAQLCGLGHYRMRGFLTVHEQADFEQWLEDNAPTGEIDPFWE